MTTQLTARTLVRDLDTLLDPTHMQDWGNNGLIIANEGPLTKIATAFTPSLAIIEQAVAHKAQALITHHGLRDLFPLIDATDYKKVKLLISNNIALIRYHLPLDAHQTLGNNWKAALDLGWQNLESFGECKGTLIGVRGTIAPTSITAFTAQLEAYYGNKAAVVAVKKEIRSVALISGGAHSYLKAAAAAGVDCFVTGSFDDPAFDTAFEENISFCGLGHAATEQVGPKALADHLRETYGVETMFINTPNPF
jgi:dinuclear metal center YbgI/SA1388 family protein